MTNEIRILAIPGKETEVFQIQVFGGIGTAEEESFKSEIETTLWSYISIHPIRGSRIWTVCLEAGRIVTTETLDIVRNLANRYGYNVVSEPA